MAFACEVAGGELVVEPAEVPLVVSHFDHDELAASAGVVVFVVAVDKSVAVVS